MTDYQKMRNQAAKRYRNPVLSLAFREGFDLSTDYWREEIARLNTALLRKQKALDLAFYYVKNDATWDVVKAKTEAILRGEENT